MIRYKLTRVNKNTHATQIIGIYQSLTEAMKQCQEHDIIVPFGKKNQIDQDIEGNKWYNTIHLTGIFGKGNEPTEQTLNMWIEAYYKLENV